MFNSVSSRLVAMVVVVAAFPVFSYAQKSLDRSTLKGLAINVRGCVKPGLDPGSVVLDHVYEIAPDGKLLPPPKPGLPTAVYSFDDASKVHQYLGRTVEVRGWIKDIRDADIDIKPAPERNGELVAELPVEGKDVRATLDELPVPVGTSGRSSLKSVVLRLDVDFVRQISESCVNP
jgi:hypothetical protein